MSLFADIKKVFIKHATVRFLGFLDADDELYQFILDKNSEHTLQENEQLKQENIMLQMDEILGKM